MRLLSPKSLAWLCCSSWIAVANSVARAQSLDPANLQFCNETASYIQSQVQRQDQMSSSGGFGVSLPIKGIPVGVDMNAADNVSSSYFSGRVEQYKSKNCDAVIETWGDIQVAKLTAEALVRVSEIQARTRIAEAQIEASSSMHNSDNQLSAIQDVNRTALRTTQNSNQTTLINTGIQAGAALLGGLFGGMEHSKDHQLELQLQRERQQHEIRLLEMQRNQNSSPPQQTNSIPVNTYPAGASPTVPQVMPYPHSAGTVQSQQSGPPIAQSTTYLSSNQQPLPEPNASNQSYLGLTSAEQEVSRHFGLQIDKSCNPSGLIIKLENAATICARATSEYPPGRYLLMSGRLVRY